MNFHPDVDLEKHLSRWVNLSFYVMWAMHVLNIKHVLKSSAVIRKEMFHVENGVFLRTSMLSCGKSVSPRK